MKYVYIPLLLLSVITPIAVLVSGLPHADIYSMMGLAGFGLAGMLSAMDVDENRESLHVLERKGRTMTDKQERFWKSNGGEGYFRTGGRGGGVQHVTSGGMTFDNWTVREMANKKELPTEAAAREWCGLPPLPAETKVEWFYGRKDGLDEEACITIQCDCAYQIERDGSVQYRYDKDREWNSTPSNLTPEKVRRECSPCSEHQATHQGQEPAPELPVEPAAEFKIGDVVDVKGEVRSKHGGLQRTILRTRAEIISVDGAAVDDHGTPMPYDVEPTDNKNWQYEDSTHSNRRAWYMPASALTLVEPEPVEAKPEFAAGQYVVDDTGEVRCVAEACDPDGTGNEIWRYKCPCHPGASGIWIDECDLSLWTPSVGEKVWVDDQVGNSGFSTVDYIDQEQSRCMMGKRVGGQEYFDLSDIHPASFSKPQPEDRPEEEYPQYWLRDKDSPKGESGLDWDKMCSTQGRSSEPWVLRRDFDSDTRELRWSSDTRWRATCHVMPGNPSAFRRITPSEALALIASTSEPDVAIPDTPAEPTQPAAPDSSQDAPAEPEEWPIGQRVRIRDDVECEGTANEHKGEYGVTIDTGDDCPYVKLDDGQEVACYHEELERIETQDAGQPAGKGETMEYWPKGTRVRALGDSGKVKRGMLGVTTDTGDGIPRVQFDNLDHEICRTYGELERIDAGTPAATNRKDTGTMDKKISKARSWLTKGLGVPGIVIWALTCAPLEWAFRKRASGKRSVAVRVVGTSTKIATWPARKFLGFLYGLVAKPLAKARDSYANAMGIGAAIATFLAGWAYVPQFCNWVAPYAIDGYMIACDAKDAVWNFFA